MVLNALLCIATVILISLLFSGLKMFTIVKLFLETLRNHFIGVDVRAFLNTSTEKAIRFTESEFGHRKTTEFNKKLTFAEGILNDLIREAGLDIKKFNVKGLVQSKLQEIGMDWSGDHRGDKK